MYNIIYENIDDPDMWVNVTVNTPEEARCWVEDILSTHNDLYLLEPSECFWNAGSSSLQVIDLSTNNTATLAELGLLQQE